METIVTALAEQQAELTDLLAGLDGPDWDRPSACEGWTVSDVVLHVAQTNELALASTAGRYDEALDAMAGTVGTPAPEGTTVDDGAALMVARERGRPGPAVRDRWQAGADALRRGLAACDPRQRVQWVAGDVSARTLATTRLAETWIHTGDVAAGLGRTLVPRDRLWHVARLAWRTLPYAFTQAGRQLTGPVAFELRGPSGNDWSFGTDDSPVTVVRGEGIDLCEVAARRVDPGDTTLVGEGPDADAVLELVRTYA